MRVLEPGLFFLGNAADLRDVASMLAAGVRAVVDLALAEAPALLPREIIYCRIPLLDGEGNDPAVLRLAVDVAGSLIRAKMPILAACGAGMSRSVAVAAAALAIVEGRSLEASLERVAGTGPHDVSPGLWRDLKRVFPERPA